MNEGKSRTHSGGARSTIGLQAGVFHAVQALESYIGHFNSLKNHIIMIGECPNSDIYL